ncbi:hypothetical protein EJB05_20888 [Eragrostis curvula]|uniref:Uncharacterized protein n=1 Tax=Eragrostis curvula TaxID=38414 RepID=A0A5J9V0B2_9POAL|nr:hypothetical protein EJB05_20888 [Eragrostis curvula]
MWRREDDVFSRSSREEDDKEALRWTALERLPTHDRVRSAIVLLGLGGDEAAVAAAKGVVDVDVLRLGPRERRVLLERPVRVADEDNKRFLLKLKERVNRVQNLDAEAEESIGSSGLAPYCPEYLNSIINTVKQSSCPPVSARCRFYLRKCVRNIEKGY